MKQARIVERQPSPSGRSFWYILVATDESESGGELLQQEPVRHLRGTRHDVDPVAKEVALKRLRAWADENGWTIDPPRREE